MTPSSATAPLGPEVPQYHTPLTVRTSHPQAWHCSISNAIVSSSTGGTPLMVHSSLLP